MAKIVVVDSVTGEPVQFATVAFLTGSNAGTGTMTNTNGVAEINGTENYGETVQVRHISYEPQTFTFEISPGVPDSLQQIMVYLMPAVYQIPTAEIFATSDGPKIAGIGPGAKWAIGILAAIVLAAAFNHVRND